MDRVVPGDRFVRHQEPDDERRTGRDPALDLIGRESVAPAIVAIGLGAAGRGLARRLQLLLGTEAAIGLPAVEQPLRVVPVAAPFRPDGGMWPAASVNARVGLVAIGDDVMRANVWLDRK